jgi:hypothetical protein
MTSAMNVDLDNPGRSGVWVEGIALTDGKSVHLATWKPEPVVCAQWCLPSRRQQAGSFESESEASAGAISEKLNRTSNRDARRRRTFSYSSVVPIPFCCSA